MATITRVRRIANPRRRRPNSKRRFSRPRTRTGQFTKRKRSRSHTKRSPIIRRYSAKILKKELRRRGVKVNPHSRRHGKRQKSYARVKAKARRRTHRRKSNPVLLELGAVNPRRRRKSVARRKRRSHNPRRHRRAKAVTRRVYRRRRRRNPPPAFAKAYGYRAHNRRRYHRRRNRRHYSRRRNPFGHSTKDLFTMGGGVLVGVAATKYIPSVLPTSVTSMLPLGSFTGVLITGASAFIAGWAAQKFMPGAFAQGVVLGGVALTVSQLLNMIAPPAISGPLALSGVGDIVSTQGFTVPNRSVMPMIVSAPAAKAGMGAFRGGGWKGRS